MVLVTGAAGFVGTALCEALRLRGINVVGAVRNDARDGQVSVGDLSGQTDWRAALAGCRAIVHLAARVHVMSDDDADPLRAYREVNVDATLNLARQAVQAGVRRFVFVSSVKVNGESTVATPFSAADVPAPCDPYGQSKLEAELALQELARETGLELVIVRPPLVYGPGVKANFLNLIRLVKSGVPLPFASIRNRRSMVALDNLVDLLCVCAEHPAAPGGVFMVSDGQDLSMPELVRMIAKAMDKRVLQLPVPAGFLAFAAKLAGKDAVAERLLGSLQVDIRNTRARLEWEPLKDPQSAINQTVAHLLRTETRKNQ